MKRITDAVRSALTGEFEPVPVMVVITDAKFTFAGDCILITTQGETHEWDISGCAAPQSSAASSQKA